MNAKTLQPIYTDKLQQTVHFPSAAELQRRLELREKILAAGLFVTGFCSIGIALILAFVN